MCSRKLLIEKKIISLFMAAVVVAASLYIPVYAEDVSDDAESGVSYERGYYADQACSDDVIAAYVYDSLYENYVVEWNTGAYYISLEELDSELLSYYTEASAVLCSDEDGNKYYDCTDAEAEATPFFNEIANSVAKAAQSFLMDHPEVFWFKTFTATLSDISVYIYGSDDCRAEYTVNEIYFEPTSYPDYDDAVDDIEEYKEAVDSVVAYLETEIAAEAAKLDDPDTETVQDITALAIHDWLADNLEYTDDTIRSPATAFLDKFKGEDGYNQALCEGYAKAFKILADRLGLTSVLINGEAENIYGEYEEHMWNNVLIGDTWYAMDVAWDDLAVKDGKMYLYYLIGSGDIGLFGDTYEVAHRRNTAYWGDATAFDVVYPVIAESRYRYITTAIDKVVDDFDVSDATYTGSAIEPDVYVRIKGVDLTEDVDYTLSYDNNINVGTASITVTGIGNYSGSITLNFEIVPMDITGTAVSSVSYVYTGSAIEPFEEIGIGGATLVEGDDFTVEYSNNVDVGTATYTITGIGNYTGAVTGTFNITKISLSSLTLPTISSQTYTGSAIKPSFSSFTYGSLTLKNGTDFSISYKNNTNVGTATVTVTGIGDHCTGSKSTTFKITARSISSATVSSIANKTYTGSAIKPTPTVKYNGKTLTKGTDYTLSYSSNTKVGTATITITGKGNFTGTKKVTFKIVAKSISSATVSSIANKTYTGSAIKPTPTVKVSGTTLKKGTDYTLSYSSNKSTGKATVTITGKGNYTGTKKVYFYIVPKKITVKSITSPKTKQIKLTWAKNSTVTGYQIQYSTSSKFTSSTTKSKTVSSSKTSLTITGLKAKKKYYVRIRGYKTVSGTKKYGSWSTVKSKTTK